MTRSIPTNINNIATDLTWMDMLKGIAIIGVFLDNWTVYYDIHFPLWGPFVQVFFILSGFGLTLTYLERKDNWNWKQWSWRRFTKIVVPYAIAVIFSFGMGMLGSKLYPTLEKQFSWTSLFAYLTFTRNFYPPSWGWNLPLWFMPVIVGLYVCFPVLIKIMEKWAVKTLLLISLLITCGTITLAIITGLYTGHQADLFTFWIFQFALGMALAYVRSVQPQKLNYLIGLGAFLVGIGLFTVSWALRTYVPYGRAYNDLITSVGIFLVLLNIGWLARRLIPVIGEMLNQLGRKSYLMYLIHFPIMAFLIGPLLRPFSTDLISSTVLGLIYIAIIFLLCALIIQPMNKLSSWLYFLFFSPYSRNTAIPTAKKRESL